MAEIMAGMPKPITDETPREEIIERACILAHSLEWQLYGALEDRETLLALNKRLSDALLTCAYERLPN